MQKLNPPPLAGDEVRSAFDASCALLRALEASAASDGYKEPERRRHISTALELVRETLAELRSVMDPNPSPRAAGFILPIRPSNGSR